MRLRASILRLSSQRRTKPNPATWSVSAMSRLQPIARFLMLSSIAAVAAGAIAGCGMQTVAAQANPTRLDTVLSQMDTASKNFQSALADVRQQIFTKVVQDTETQTGQVYFLRKGGSMLMGMKMSAPDAKPGSPPAQVVEFKDGKLRIYNPGINHVDEYSTAGHQAMAETFLTLGFGGSGADLKKAWTIDDQGPEQMSDGNKTIPVEKLDLISKDTDMRKNFTHITIWVDPTRAVSLKQVIFFPKGDTRTEFYTNIRPNQSIDTAAFAIKCKNNKCS
jgi:outer membrane lipoprotein-sorting protein